MLRWLVVFTALLVLLGVWGSAALAQTSTPTTTTTSSSTGGFDSLSPGNQKIARALFDAQTTTTTSSGTTTSQPLTLDEIAAKKQSGQGWGNIFKDMKAQGLVQEKNLGQVVSGHQRSTRGGTSTTDGGAFTASGRELSSARRGHGGKSFDDAAGDKQSYSRHSGKYEDGSSGRGHTYTSGSSHSGSGLSGAGRSGGGSADRQHKAPSR